MLVSPSAVESFFSAFSCFIEASNSFLKFCSSMNIPHKSLQKQDLKGTFKNCEGGVMCKEGSINIFRMRERYMKVLTDNNCRLEMNKEIQGLCRKKNRINKNFKKFRK